MPIPHIEDILLRAISQKGTKYVFGAETTAGKPSPQYDCSELVEWSCESEGLMAPDGAINQYRWIEKAGLAHPASQANIYQRGWLAFPYPNIHHVVFLLGDGTTMEAKGKAYGVGIFSAIGRFQRCGPIPGVDYTPRRKWPSDRPVQEDPMPAPKDVTASAVSGPGVLMLQADGGIISDPNGPKPTFFGSLFSLPPEDRLLSDGEFCSGLAVFKDHIVISTNRGDTYSSLSPKWKK